jgi:catechol 2,3-dioxygenase-like lactoylglutathione lyase family enzyme
MAEIQPVPMSVGLEVSDVQASVAWYQAALGFNVLYMTQGLTATLAHLRREQHQELLLYRAAPGGLEKPGQGVTLEFQAGGATLDEIACRARGAGEYPVVGPDDLAWNTRELTVYDPDGYRLRFIEPKHAGGESPR